MLNSQQSMVPPADPNAPARLFHELLKALADPAAATERLKKLEVAEASAAAQIDKAQRDMAAAHKLKADVETSIAKQRADHDQHIATERQACDEYVTRSRAEIDGLKASAAEHDRMASAARADAERGKAEVSRRLRAMEGVL